jgi:hypothetical protein
MPGIVRKCEWTGRGRWHEAGKIFPKNFPPWQFSLGLNLIRVTPAGSKELRRKGIMTVFILIFCKLLLTREEAAEILGIGIRKLDEVVARGELKPRRIDGSVRFFVGELVRFASHNISEVNEGGIASEADDDRA